MAFSLADIMAQLAQKRRQIVKHADVIVPKEFDQ